MILYNWAARPVRARPLFFGRRASFPRGCCAGRSFLVVRAVLRGALGGPACSAAVRAGRSVAPGIRNFECNFPQDSTLKISREPRGGQIGARADRAAKADRNPTRRTFSRTCTIAHRRAHKTRRDSRQAARLQAGTGDNMEGIRPPYSPISDFSDWL